ncbi:50S ribosomal protein L23 [Patescibacteria group bacterium]|nr:50S ribosomal protein L23 [Patescibacteria group bacterium]
MTFTQILRQRAKKSSSAKALQKLSPYQIILAPIVTEKAYKGSESDGAHKYSFKVHADANKIDVKQAVQIVYNVTPEAINVSWVKEKGRSNRSLVRRSYKKAVVSLKKGDKIVLAD